MKQHITQKQLDELKGKPREVLSDWCLKNVKGYHNPYFCSLPLLSIGQMIEYLGDDWFRKVSSVQGDKICDALWKAVKEKK